MMSHLNPTPEQLAELLALPDDALLNVREAAAFLRISPNSLNWYRSLAPERGPDYVRLNGKAVRYRAGDLRAFAVRNGAMSPAMAASARAMADGRAKKRGA